MLFGDTRQGIKTGGPVHFQVLVLNLLLLHRRTRRSIATSTPRCCSTLTLVTVTVTGPYSLKFVLPVTATLLRLSTVGRVTPRPDYSLYSSGRYFPLHFARV